MRSFILYIAALLLLSCQDKKPNIIPVRIYVYHTDSATNNVDLNFLRSLPYVTDLKFRSQAEATKEFTDADTNWVKVLGENPLPDAYHVMVNTDMLPGGDIQVFKDTVNEKIQHVAEIAVPTLYKNK